MNGLHGPKRKGRDIMAWIGYVVLLSVSLRHLLISLPSQPIFRHAFWRSSRRNPCPMQRSTRMSILSKKLEGVTEHREKIFSETFGLTDLMTGSFWINNTILNLSWRNVVCDFVAQDLVSFSLNMHGTRVVQKMIRSLAGKLLFCSLIYILNLQMSSRLIIDTILRSTLSMSHAVSMLSFSSRIWMVTTSSRNASTS